MISKFYGSDLETIFLLANNIGNTYQVIFPLLGIVWPRAQNDCYIFLEIVFQNNRKELKLSKANNCSARYTHNISHLQRQRNEIYIHICVCMYACMYVCIHQNKKREKNYVLRAVMEKIWFKNCTYLRCLKE